MMAKPLWYSMYVRTMTAFAMAVTSMMDGKSKVTTIGNLELIVISPWISIFTLLHLSYSFQIGLLKASSLPQLNNSMIISFNQNSSQLKSNGQTDETDQCLSSKTITVIFQHKTI